MSYRVQLETDEHGCWLCPLCGPTLDTTRDECQWRGLYLIWEHNVPLVDMDSSVVDGGAAARLSVTNGWKVECINGHVLAVSQGEENAEPFDPAVFRETLRMPVVEVIP